MAAPLLLTLSLGLSIAVAALALAGGVLAERFSPDPRLRERAWAAGLTLPVLPPIAVALLLAFTPAPVLTAAVPAGVMAAPAPVAVEAAPVAAAPPPTVDWNAAAGAVLAIAGLLMLARLTGLGLRARRLARLVRGAEAASPEVAGAVARLASGLAVAPPRILVSAAAPEALLTALGRPRLLLPAALARAAGGAAARAVIAHELAHLKRGDHRALWLEETLLVLLAANPLMPLLRVRRAAAREEACDALALAGAAPGTRRAYAQSLIEALRDRAGPQAVGGLPALTFTGAGRTTAMHRLKAVLTPAAPAGRRTRLAVAAAGAALLAAAAAGSVAVAAQREPVVRFARTPDRPVTTDIGRASDIDRTGAGLNIVLKREPAAQDAPPADSPLSPDRQARYRGLSAQGYREVCASNDPGDDGFCAGVMFAQMGSDGVCPPAGAAGGDTGAALAAYVERGRRVMTDLPPRADEGAYGYAGRAMARAFPCPAQAARADGAAVLMPVSLDLDGAAPVLAPDELLWIGLVDERQAVIAESVATSANRTPTSRLDMALTDRQFPSLNGARRVYTLTGEIRAPDGTVRYRAEPVTIRLAPGSRRTARNLNANLTFRPG